MQKGKTPILFAEKQNCCGCTACVNICPREAIILNKDSEGFLYPQIDEEKCIGCLKCIRVCPLKDNNTTSCS